MLRDTFGRNEEVSGTTTTALASRDDREPHTGEQRRRMLLERLDRFLPMQEWELSWGDRGLVLTHEDHRVPWPYQRTSGPSSSTDAHRPHPAHL